MLEPGVEHYLLEIETVIDEWVGELQKLSQVNSLKKTDFYLAERLLQMLTEACIGLSKHWLRSLNMSAGRDAYASFEKLFDKDLITAEELKNWRKVIGLRNAMVHDYLNLDRAIIEKVVLQREYLFCRDFSRLAIGNMRRTNKLF